MFTNSSAARAMHSTSVPSASVAARAMPPTSVDLTAEMPSASVDFGPASSLQPSQRQASITFKKVTWWDGYNQGLKPSDKSRDDPQPSSFQDLTSGIHQWMEKGVLSPSTNIPSVLVHDSWSMWEVVLPALGFTILHSVGNILGSTSESLKGHCFFLAGSWSFVMAAWKMYENWGPIIVSLFLDEPQNQSVFPNASWFRILHSHCDGVTSGVWWCATSFPHLLVSYPKLSGRHLRHVISPMVEGKQVKCKVDATVNVSRPLWTTQGFHFGGLLPAQKLSALVLCPSVFKKYVTRMLNLEEIKHCWDLGPDQAADVPLELNTRNPPAKLLLSFGRNLARSLKTEAVLLHLKMGSLNPDARVFQPRALETPNDHPASEGADLFPGVQGRQNAAKDDDAEIPVAYWDEPFWHALVVLGRKSPFIAAARNSVIGKGQRPILSVLRGWVLRLWRVSVLRSLLRYLASEDVRDRTSDLVAGRDCLHRVSQADFWEWHGGSRLFFWRWPPSLLEWARDGAPVYFNGEMPNLITCQQTPENEHTKDQVAKKLTKFVTRRYIVPGSVNSLISYFSVPKGELDIRLVFAGTKSGLNSKIWAPSFCLPSVDSLLPMLEPGTWQSDIDVGEQFYNFLLHPSIRPYCGIDVDPYLWPEGQQKRMSWMQWERCVMGLSSSPHGCVRMQMFAEELVQGNHQCISNPFYFDRVRLNLPGDVLYSPNLPRVSKIDSRGARMAGDMSTYVDDVRNTGALALQCWKTSHRISTIFCYLGIQDALRKRTLPSLDGCLSAY
jgi:hypothetical protein